ncbi:Rft protein-domain-containing protein [Pisolithus orientalis]|uniref:Rft protein-domain-containing protein n=1 Tax=Pisolithus orientalis TaxID=936130 RepID=UPI00222555DB|nr:Rft protein-domain-containing protein [Pisolithus orientalis]KAI6019713.1 Rft protein-domain-containing protein [Pisolithus orientalis]
MDNNSLLERSISSAKSLIGLQLVSRIFTFVLNQGLVRLASPQAYGTVAVQFELFINTILFLSREGVRNSLLRVWPQQGAAGNNSKKTLQFAQCSNLATVPAMLGIPVTLLSVMAYGYTASEDVRSQPLFQVAPMHNRAMGEARTSVRVRAEGLGISSKTAVTYLALLLDTYLGEQKFTLIAFALGQITYSSIIFVIYLLEMPDSRLLPVRLSLTSSRSPPIRSRGYRLLADFFDLNALPPLYDYDAAFLVSYWSPLRDQGGYAIAVNYGSLIARIAFQPIEEICRVYFSRVLSFPRGTPRGSGNDMSAARPALKQASEALATLLSIQVVFSVLVVTFGSLYLPIVMQILLPHRYLTTSAPQVLLAWIWYIPFLSVNGGLEAFHSSTASPEDLREQSWWMFAYSGVYILAAISFYKLGFGDASLVYANIINLSARILFTTAFTFRYFTKHLNSPPFGVADIFPDWRFLGAVAVSCTVVSVNESRQRIVELSRGRTLFSVPVLLHILLGASMGLLCVAVWWFTTGRRVVAKLKTKTA